MKLKNSEEFGYGLMTILTHGAVAVLVLGLFILGVYMVGLDYTHRHSYSAPLMHKGFGFVCMFVIIFRFLWSFYSPLPKRYFVKNTESYLVMAFRLAFYLFVSTIIISGYLIVTADIGGDGVEFFKLFKIPSLFTPFEGQEEAAGLIHKLASYAVIVPVAVHGVYRFKKVFIDKLIRRISP